MRELVFQWNVENSRTMSFNRIVQDGALFAMQGTPVLLKSGNTYTLTFTLTSAYTLPAGSPGQSTFVLYLDRPSKSDDFASTTPVVTVKVTGCP